jgi:hypothetical protein
MRSRGGLPLKSGRLIRSSKARLENYLSHMLEAAYLARQYVEGVVKDEFLTDRRTQQCCTQPDDDGRGRSPASNQQYLLQLSKALFE